MEIMKSEKARQYFIAHSSSEISDKNLSVLLNSLSVIYNKRYDIKKLMNNISEIIDWNKVNHIQNAIEFNKEPENTQFITDMHSWAKKTFYDSLKNGNIDKLIISYMLGDYLFLEPVLDFQWGNISENTEKKLKELYINAKSEIILHEKAKYTNRKYYSDYQKSLTNGSLKEIFDFLSAIEHGRGYDYHFEKFFHAITNICYKINSHMISEVIGSLDPLLLKILFNALDPYQSIVVLKGYNKSSIFPLIIGLNHIINPTWNNQYSNSLKEGFDFIKDAASIVKKISDITDTDNLYKYITDCSNIFGNTLWHSIYIAFGVQNPAFLDSYINSIDFSLAFGAENVFETFCHFVSEENINILDDFSIKLYHSYLEYLKKECSYVRNYCGTNYLDFLIYAAYAESEKNHVKYGELLKEASVDFERVLYSWDTKRVTMYFTRLIVWVLALNYFSDKIIEDKIDLSYTINIFLNEKYLNAFTSSVNGKKIDYKILAGYLRNPKGYIEIKLPLSFDTYTITKFNRTEMDIDT